MSLNNKILLLIVSALSLFILSFLYFWKYNAQKIDELQNIRVQEFQATFGELLDLHGDKFQTMNYDYSYWDEMVSFVESKNHRWAEVNLKEPMHVNHIDYCVVYDTRGQVVHYDQSSSALPDLRKRLPLSTFRCFHIILSSKTAI
ncbi:MAG: CHASE4 domain-containing protein [Sulfuricurvum sp.]|nr:CHASE4 domain-containing protein [Sulfuricurvum sp.]